MVSFKASSTLIWVEVLSLEEDKTRITSLHPQSDGLQEGCKGLCCNLSLYRIRSIGASEKRSEREMFEIVI